MKTIKMILALSAAAVMAIACQKYDDTALTQRVDKLETRVSSLESAMAALKTAVDSKYAVDKVEETENGYKIFFTNGKTIELLNGKNGAQGPQGDKGEDGDSFLRSVTETAEYVVIVLNDETETTFKLPKAVKITIGGEDVVTVYQNEVLPIELPAVEGLVSVTAVVQEGSTVVLSKAGSEWNAVLADDLKSVKVKTTAKNGTKALLQLFAVKADGTTYTSSKTLVAETSVTYGDVEYKITKLADGNVWFAENLRYVPEGKTVAELKDDYTGVTCDGIYYPATYAVVDGKAVVTPSNDAEVVAAQGLLYTTLAAMNGAALPTEDWADASNTQGICPEGWHIPTAQEWVDLVGGCAAASRKNVEAPYYVETLAGADLAVLNADGLNFLPYPYVNQGKKYLGSYLNKRVDSEYNKYASMAYFQSSTGRSATQNYGAMITNNATKTSVNCAYNFLTNATPVRCIKNK